MIRLPLLLLGYLFGCFHTSYFYGKLHGIDIREHGSGNAGTTNALRVMGTKAGIIVFLGDLGKMALALFITGLMAKSWGEEYYLLTRLYTAFGVIIGHLFPFFMNFRGGKGIASTGGLMLLLDWRTALFGFISFFGLTILTGYVSLGSIVMVCGEWILFLILILTGTLPAGIMPVWEAILLLSIIVALALIRHRENIQRLQAGTENKLELFKKKSAKKGE